MNCSTCGKPIPAERLAALPNTTTCVGCSDEPAKHGFTVWDKTTPTLAILDGDELDELKRLERGDGRHTRLK